MDEEQLIGLVNSFPELYDISNKFYSNNTRKENSWAEISYRMNESVEDCKDKWRKIRDSYRKALNVRRTKGIEGALKRPWKFEKQLEFLLPFIFERKSKSILSDTESLQHVFVKEEDSTELDDQFTPEPENIPTSPSPASKRMRMNYPQLTMDTPNMDTISSFFVSMGETVKTLPPRTQIDLKAKIFKLVNDAEIAALEMNSHYPQPNTDLHIY